MGQRAWMVVCTVLAFSIGWATSAAAQTDMHWTGNGDWMAAGNWSPPGPPAVGDNVFFHSHLTRPAVIGASNAPVSATINDLNLAADNTKAGQAKIVIQNGSSLTINGNANIGTNPNSTTQIFVESGSHLVTNGYAFLAGSLGGGHVTVTGAGSTWAIHGAAGFIAGNGLNPMDNIKNLGFLTIADQGSVTIDHATIFGVDQGEGTLKIDTAGMLISKGEARVGGKTAADPGIGAATVSGAGSTWSISGPLSVGYGGTGTLTIESDGLVKAAAGTTIGEGVNSKGTLDLKSGGTLETFQLKRGASAVANGVQVNFDGGILRATANNSAFLSGFSGTELNLAAGGLTVDTAGFTVSPDATSLFTGSGGLTVTGGGTFALLFDQTYTGPTTVRSGTLEVNAQLASPVTVESAGILSGVGTINNTVVNSGTVAPGTGGINQALTINGNYVGNGGILAISTILGDSASPTNQLVITGAGHTASGTTGVVVTNYQGLGPGAQTSGNGIPIIVAENGATTDAGAFSLAKRAAAGPFEYLLFKGTSAGNGGADAENSWYLRSHSDAPIPGGPLLPPGEPVPLYRPEVPLYSAMGALTRQQQQTTLGTFHDRNGDQRLATAAGNRTAAWGRLFGEHLEQSSSGLANARFDGDTGGLQSGVDVLQWVSPSGHQDRYGLFAAYTRSTGGVRGFALGVENLAAGRIELDGTSFGAYWTHLAPGGWYTDAVIMGTRFNADGHSMGNEVDITGSGVTASIEGGYPIPIAPGLRLEPQAQLVYSHVNLDDVDDLFSEVAFDTPDALWGRIGVRLSADLAPLPYVLRPYLKANIWQHFTETDTIRFSGVHEVRSRHEATTLEFGGGVVAQLSRDVGLWVNADYTTDIGGTDDEIEAIRGTAGLRVTW